MLGATTLKVDGVGKARKWNRINLRMQLTWEKKCRSPGSKIIAVSFQLLFLLKQDENMTSSNQLEQENKISYCEDNVAHCILAINKITVGLICNNSIDG
uniref:Uncharacterized protein n=1 Tax=Onchocerca volvulus TaxID=6282 RepID=A0A8R1XXD6_ONCVO